MSLAGPMLFDPRAFWGDEDVKILSYAQAGIYLRLISHQWEEGSVPSDERRLASVLTSATTQDEVDEVLTLFFEDSDGDGRLRNPRTAEDRAAWIAKKAKAKKDGRKGGKAKARGLVESPSRDPRPTLDQPQRDPKGSVESPSTISSSCSPPSPLPVPLKNEGEDPLSVGNATRSTTALEVEDSPAKQKKRAATAEMNWRIAETWRSFLDRRELWFQRSKGIDKPPGRPPTLTDDIKADIRRALKVHDGELLGEDDREEWLRDSKTRAAGEGMFLKEWNVGLREGTNGDGARGSTYTEPWRPWKIRKGRDPVDEFAEVYFVKRAASEARR